MVKKLFIIEYYIIINLFLLKHVNNKIIFVYQHSRHGARAPLSKFNQTKNFNNTYFDEYNISWREEGNLTLKGKMQHYILGIRNRYKYPNLINFTKFNPSELLIHVTKKNRVKFSAYYQLLGMYNPIINISKNDSILINNISNKYYYPPNYIIWEQKLSETDKNIINEAELSIKYLKENINTNKFDEYEINNYIFAPYLKNRTFYSKNHCKNYKKYLEYKYLDKYKELIKKNLEGKYGDIFQKYFKYDKKEYLYNIENSSTLIDNYIVNIYEEKNLTNFLEKTKICKEDFYNTSLLIYDWWLYNIAVDKIICFIESSKLMEDLIEYIDNKIYKKSNINIVIDLGHDRTLGSMEFLMHQIFNVNYYFTHFASNVIFELEEINDENKCISNYYINYYIDEQLQLNISYEKFKKNILDGIWNYKKIDDFCFGNITILLNPEIYLFFRFFIFSIFLFILIIIIFKYSRRKRLKRNKKSEKYYEENKENNKEMELI